ncbi:MAG: cell division protein FtsK [Deltaproteobacteria bacterium]|nr:cell division protein FtsK [Deltaproteobacteria bacterium]
MFQGFGLGALIFPPVMFVYAYNLIWNADFHLTSGRMISWFGFILSFSSLMALWFNSFRLNGATIPAGGINGTMIPAGGIAGDIIAQLVLRYMSPIGGFLMILALFVVTAMLAAHLSFKSIVESTLTFPNRIFTGLNNIWMIQKERRKRLAGAAAEKERFEEAHKTPPSVVVEKVEKEVKRFVDKAVQEELPMAGLGFRLPPLSILDEPVKGTHKIDKEAMIMNSRILEKKLLDYGIEGRVSEVRPGPVITMFEFEPAPGVKISRIASLADDLAMALRAVSIRIVAPIPGKAAVGIEIPNANREAVFLREILEWNEFQNTGSRLTLALGKDIGGNSLVSDLARMPHLLVAGATGAGKSVSVNSMIMSILFKATPDEVRFLMVDPKMIELSVYDGIPHLLLPVVTDPKKASVALKWAVKEMERRYSLLAELGVRNIDSYNKKIEKEGRKQIASTIDGETVRYHERLPYIVVIIDELADLMVVARKEVEESIARLAQMARASGIHLLIATQRPSVDVLTGVIKANFPTRISFQVSSKVDSRTILDANGAETLLGSGDMLFLPPGTSKLTRIHGAYVSDREIRDVVSFLKKQGTPAYDEEILKVKEEAGSSEGKMEDLDEKYDEAVSYVIEAGEASISKIQRKFKIGYNRAARIVEKMEEEGLLAHSDGTGRPREVLRKA